MSERSAVQAPMLKYLESYLALVELYRLIREAYADRVYIDKELTAKTRTLLRERTIASALELPSAIHELGPRELAALQASDSSDQVKIINLRRILAQTVDENRDAKPFLRPIGERAEEIAKAYGEGQLATQAALDAFMRLAETAVESDTERARLGINPNAFAIYAAVKPLHEELSPEQATSLDSVFGAYPDFPWNQDQANQLRTDLYKALLPIVGAVKIISATNAIL